MQTNRSRSSGIELLKIIAVFLIVINHVVQTLHTAPSVDIPNEYVLDVLTPSLIPRNVMIAMLRQCGLLGNFLFFVSSAWFLTDRDVPNRRKLIRLISDNLTISVTILLISVLIIGTSVTGGVILKSVFPTTMMSNWYVSCYVLFYAIHGYLNRIIQTLDKRSHFRLIAVMIVLYGVVDFLLNGLSMYFSDFIIWICVYFIIAYIKKYSPQILNGFKRSVTAAVIAAALNVLMVISVDLAEYRFGVSDLSITLYSGNPFVITLAISLFNIFRQLNFSNIAVNYCSSLSLMVYLIHENIIIRLYYRPRWWLFLYNTYGYSHIFLLIFLMALVIFAASLVLSAVYKESLGRLTAAVSDRLYKLLSKASRRIEKKIL